MDDVEPMNERPIAPPVAETAVNLDWIAEQIPYRLFQECIHCGLCTASCPTYVLNGDENDSPRGRIYLMRSVVDGRLGVGPEIRRHLELCLDCRACETACPSGVQYGRLIEPFKIEMIREAPPGKGLSRLQKLILHHLFPYASRVRAALLPVRVLQKIGLMRVVERSGLLGLLPRTLREMEAMVPPPRAASNLPVVLPAIGPKRARVGLFLGCVTDVMTPQTTEATARVLRRNGCEVVTPRAQACCGAIHYHSGAEAPAVALARRNMDAFDFENLDAIVVNAAGCGAMFKGYEHILPPEDRERAARFVAKIKDVSEFLAALGPIPPTHAVPVKATYHDACHLCHGQQIRAQPRQLLGLIPGLELVPLAESELCCGAAGTYNLTEPETSKLLGRRKLANIEATGATVVASGNIGCTLQIARQIRERGLAIEIVHPVDLLDRAYEGDS
jgi:glycolate oxidase iron-sulfur subunit